MSSEFAYEFLREAFEKSESRLGLLPGPSGVLEVFFEPSERRTLGPCAVICHPNPRAGGTMGHKVVQTAAKAARKAGYHALRFNYRGVGKSQGVHGENGEERADVRAMLEAARRVANERDPIVQIGFSFGTWVGIPEAEIDARVRAIVAIGMPLDARDFPYASGYGEKPLLAVHGEKDEFGSMASMRRWVAARPAPTRLATIDCGHFFHGKLKELEEAIVPFLESIRSPV